MGKLSIGQIVKGTTGLAAAATGGAALSNVLRIQNKVVEAQNSKFNDPAGSLIFPADLISSERSYFMTMQFMDYERRSIFNRPFLKANGGVRLPLPNNLVDTQAVTYEKEAAPAAVGAAIEQGLHGANSKGGEGGGVLSAVRGAAAGFAAGSIVDAPRKLAEAAGLGSVVSQGLQLAGLAQNPFLTVLFKQPEFKRHQFSWKLTPNNQQESNTVRDIILTLKSNMLPAMAPSAGGTLLTYPSMVIISLDPVEEYMYKFKPCVIESMSVNYAASGLPSFFSRSGAPTDVSLTLNLMEIEYWLKEDIVDPAGTMAAAAADFSGSALTSALGL